MKLTFAGGFNFGMGAALAFGLIGLLLFLLAGCRAAGNWTLNFDQSGVRYTCEPLEGQEDCSVLPDIPVITAIADLLKEPKPAEPVDSAAAEPGLPVVLEPTP